MTTDLERDLAALAATLAASTVAVRSARGAGSGSGVVWSAGGTIVTNAHVAQTPQVEIELPGGRRLPGTVERRDERRDLAAIRIAAGGLTPVQLRDPGELRVGELVAAFGHPLGVANVLSTGIVYAAHRSGADRFVRSDVKLAPGNSGGALADCAGRVVGINSMIAGQLALAIPAGNVRQFMGEATPVRRLGVRLAAVRLPGNRPAFAILAVEPDSAAQHSGLLPGDVLLGRDAQRFATASTLALLRAGEALSVTVVGPANEAAAAA